LNAIMMNCILASISMSSLLSFGCNVDVISHFTETMRLDVRLSQGSCHITHSSTNRIK
jgi:hypothetical protein